MYVCIVSQNEAEDGWSGRPNYEVLEVADKASWSAGAPADGPGQFVWFEVMFFEDYAEANQFGLDEQADWDDSHDEGGM